MSFTDSFDARSVPPQQGFAVHPPGMFDAQISNTYAKPTASGTGGMFVIEFTTPAGRIENRYNLWNPSSQAMEIAQKELSALCHATAIYKITFPKNQDGSPILEKAGFELRGGRCKVEIAPQTRKNSEGKFEETGYMEVKKVYDANGNEPGKTGSAPQPMQTQPQQQTSPPVQPNGNGGWGAPQSQSAQQQPAANTGWSQQQQTQPNPANPATPPWGR